ncbi:MAG TPA: hypothetical protein VLR89_09695 [Anaerolineaceae bacterium]|nr:hypothetical protein [Anaerolineaceae bacterium]
MTTSKNSPLNETKLKATKIAASQEEGTVWSAEERAAMHERAKELKAVGRGKSTADAEADVLAKIAEMPEPDQSMARWLHEQIKAQVPDLSPKTWYGMPAYAKDGKIVCFFQSSAKFKVRYSTLGFNEAANLDEGVFWPVAYAVKALTATEKEKIIDLVKRAAS